MMGTRSSRAGDFWCFASQKPHFFKIVVDETLQQRKLRLPRKFLKKYSSILPKTLFLRVPTGKVWEVELAKRGYNAWLSKGWQEFACYYSLAYGHLLVFEYQGCTEFNVMILDRTATEIKYPCNAPSRSASSDDFVEVLDDHLNEDEISVEILDGLRPTTHVQRSTSKKRRVAETFGETSRKTKVAKQNVSLTLKKNSKALQRASAFQSEKPHFTLIIHPSYVDNTPTVSKAFFEKHIKDTPLDALLMVEHKLWPVKISIYESNSPKISQGWPKFARENGIEVGDVCVFQQVKMKIFEFKVWIFKHDG